MKKHRQKFYIRFHIFLTLISLERWVNDLNPGLLNKRIEILTIGEGYDADGYPVEGEVVYKKLWSQVIPISVKDYSEAKATQTENITKFVIRYSKSLDITNSMFIKYIDKRFKVESVLNDEEKNITLTIIGRSVV